MELPILIKQLDREYFVGVDISRENKEEKRFTFCVMSRKKGCPTEKPQILILQHFIYRMTVEKENFLTSLKEFYNCPILIETT